MPDSQTELAHLGISISDQDGASFDGIAFLSRRSSVVVQTATNYLQLHDTSSD
jgi:hypothetical protein